MTTATVDPAARLRGMDKPTSGVRTLGEASALVLLLLILIPVSWMVRAWAVMLFWGWFVVPVFPALPVLSFVGALGIVLFRFVLKMHPVPYVSQEEEAANKREPWKAFWRNFHGTITGLILWVGIGWVVQRLTG